MRWAPRAFPVKIQRRLNVAELAEISPDELEQAEEAGALAGNRAYCDLRGCGWGDVRTALDIETTLIDRLKMADDVEAEMSAFEEERATEFDDEPALWGLDVGVAAATIAISAYGAIPVSSCNAGAFGGRHPASHPYVAFFLPKDLAPEIMRCAEAADIGLLCDASGLAQIFGRGEMDLFRFAQTAWQRNAAGKKRPDDERI